MRLFAILAVLLLGAGSAFADCAGHTASNDQTLAQSGKKAAQQSRAADRQG